MTEDWYAWHDRYNDPRTGLARRLTLVQDRVRAALDEAPPGPLRVISLCAGQGADLIVPLSRHPRRGDVTARLVELERGFERVWVSGTSDPGFRHRVGVHRFTGTPAPLERDAVMFTFVGHDIKDGPPRG